MPVLKKVSKFTPRRVLFQLAVLALALIVLVPQFREFLEVPLSFDDIRLGWMVLAAIAVAVSMLAAAQVYIALVRPRLKTGMTVVVQLATSFTNRLLPAGIGGMGTYVRYLYKRKVSATNAAVVVGANQLIGIFSFVLLAAFLGLTSAGDQVQLSFSPKTFGYLGAIVGVGFLLAIVLRAALPKVGKKITHVFKQVLNSIIQLASKPAQTSQALVYTLAITACYTAALYACSRAVGVELTMREVLFVYMAGSAAASVAPTPGGLGPVEAALVTSLKSVNVATSPAVTTVLLYRLISFWLPILPGYLAFRYLMRHKQL